MISLNCPHNEDSFKDEVKKVMVSKEQKEQEEKYDFDFITKKAKNILNMIKEEIKEKIINSEYTTSFFNKEVKKVKFFKVLCKVSKTEQFNIYDDKIYYDDKFREKLEELCKQDEISITFYLRDIIDFCNGTEDTDYGIQVKYKFK